MVSQDHRKSKCIFIFYCSHENMLSTRGNCLFYGNNALNTSMWQAVNLTEFTDASLIDNQTIHFNLSAWLGGYGNHNDRVTVFLTFLDTSNRMVGQISSIGPVTNVLRNSATSFLFEQTNGIVPTGARSILVYVVIERDIGGINVGYADDINVSLYI